MSICNFILAKVQVTQKYKSHGPTGCPWVSSALLATSGTACTHESAMESKDGVLIGQKGVKYGLQKPALAAKKPALAAQPVRKPAVFGADDSDEDFEAEVARVAEKKRTAQKVSAGYLAHQSLPAAPCCLTCTSFQHSRLSRTRVARRTLCCIPSSRAVPLCRAGAASL